MHAPVAQLVEQTPYTRTVPGPSPGGRTHFDSLRSLSVPFGHQTSEAKCPEPSRRAPYSNHMRRGIRVSFAGTGIEAVGMALDILHHINIGISAPEGLITPFHATIFIGFVINFIGVFMTFRSSRKS